MTQKSQPTKTGTKRPRGKFAASSSAPQPYDPSRFPTLGQYERFLKMDKYKVWPEKVFDIHLDGHHYRLLPMFTSRKWTKLISPYTKINHDMLKEFYANVVTDASYTTMDDTFSFTIFVRGKIIRFDRDAINDFLGNPLTLLESEEPTMPTLCPMVRKTGKEIGTFGRLRRTSFSRTEGS